MTSRPTYVELDGFEMLENDGAMDVDAAADADDGGAVVGVAAAIAAAVDAGGGDDGVLVDVDSALVSAVEDGDAADVGVSFAGDWPNVAGLPNVVAVIVAAVVPTGWLLKSRLFVDPL